MTRVKGHCTSTKVGLTGTFKNRAFSGINKKDLKVQLHPAKLVVKPEI